METIGGCGGAELAAAVAGVAALAGAVGTGNLAEVVVAAEATRGAVSTELVDALPPQPVIASRTAAATRSCVPLGHIIR